MRTNAGWQEDWSFLPILSPYNLLCHFLSLNPRWPLAVTSEYKWRNETPLHKCMTEISSAFYNTVRLSNIAKVALLCPAICCNLMLSTFDKVFTTNAFCHDLLEVRIWALWYFQMIKHHFFFLQPVLRKYLLLKIRIDPSYYALSGDKNKLPDSGFLNLTLIYSQQKVHGWELEEKCWKSTSIIIR